MFDVEVDAPNLKKVLSVLETVTSEVLFTATDEGIDCVAVDPAHVAMVRLHIDSSFFESYTVKNCEFGVSLPKLKQIVNLAGKDSLHIKLDESILVIKIGKITRKMGLVAVDSKAPKIPKLALPVSLSVNQPELKRAVAAISDVTEVINLDAKKGELVVSGSNKTDEVFVVLPHDGKETATSMFPLDYFSGMVKVACNDISLKMGNDMPLIARFGDVGWAVDYLMAPRIERE